ncbi:mevalonate kinase [Saccharolobus solfataricus]|uniref:Mevalonate kinase n=3 Tax=Saccharolobus solfataricus TaxID=2287 RepID=MVK_SACS2|nr:mevalonate kinase [Saccharolobus solfataricus]Q980D2.1 RecName: Full=Mevalonate kinase; Short=MK; Short=MVK [Saccharolobus solfataricus P2]AAK40711.1 Mevalonate kinase [Saccharolobus solfataricus P2]AKA73687.1 mevalonate kinase [Saccharolobus solfataricus]AKA76384.1 mevalonate kinase [Saccharolobus solfataricus]AKA79076.1 mevalonate kinase [Saccharolobus solfataricus]AZF68158.1 mevalonate kinase [Saccharolobus solfataricus]
MMVEAKVPLKLTLFGEHAVVYDRPAIAMTISESLKVKVSENDKFLIISPSLNIKGVKLDLNEMKIESDEAKKVLRYVFEVLNYFEMKKPVKIEINSTVEPSVGLGTSAAVIVGTVAAYSKYLGIDLSRDEIAKISHNIELKVQGIASRMDTYTETYGGLIYFPAGGKGFEKIDTNFELTAGYIRRSMSTADVLWRVRTLKESNKEVFENILDVIGEITNRAKSLIVEQNFEELGLLMYVNHGLLFSLGITSPEADEIVSRAKQLGIKGCKISGGGAGGSIICIKSVEAEVLLRSYNARIVNSTLTKDGVIFSIL